MSLPDLMLLSDAAGADTVAKLKNYYEAIYQEFCRTAAHADLTFQGARVICPFKQPAKEGGFKDPPEMKHHSFWHCTSDGPEEETRIFDLRRCERIRWIGWVIQHADDPTLVRWWENQRPGKRGPKIHVPLWLFDHDYAVILNKDSDRYYLRSAYVLKPKRTDDFEAEWQANVAAKKAEAAG